MSSVEGLVCIGFAQAGAESGLTKVTGGSMGATFKQGWFLFTFMVGFTLGPAGLVALGWPIALIGFALMAAALAGFYSIKEPVTPGRAAARGHVVASEEPRTASRTY
jgi:hypothetical protein